MPKFREEWDDDELYDMDTPRRQSKPKIKKEGQGKGHQTRHGKRLDGWNGLDLSLDDLYSDPVPIIPVKPAVKPIMKPTLVNKPQPSPTSPTSPTTTKKPSTFTPGPNSHTIKGAVIDFDRVQNIEKIDNVYNGKTTFGIKFIFVGKKGLSRVIWFNQNNRERDAIYNTEYAFWKNLTNNK